jgi:hypothetical protein
MATTAIFLTFGPEGEGDDVAGETVGSGGSGLGVDRSESHPASDATQKTIRKHTTTQDAFLS